MFLEVKDRKYQKNDSAEQHQRAQNKQRCGIAGLRRLVLCLIYCRHGILAPLGSLNDLVLAFLSNGLRRCRLCREIHLQGCQCVLIAVSLRLAVQSNT